MCTGAVGAMVKIFNSQVNATTITGGGFFGSYSGGNVCLRQCIVNAEEINGGGFFGQYFSSKIDERYTEFGGMYSDTSLSECTVRVTGNIRGGGIFGNNAMNKGGILTITNSHINTTGLESGVLFDQNSCINPIMIKVVDCVFQGTLTGTSVVSGDIAGPSSFLQGYANVSIFNTTFNNLLYVCDYDAVPVFNTPVRQVRTSTITSTSPKVCHVIGDSAPRSTSASTSSGRIIRGLYNVPTRRWSDYEIFEIVRIEAQQLSTQSTPATHLYMYFIGLLIFIVVVAVQSKRR